MASLPRPLGQAWSGGSACRQPCQGPPQPTAPEEAAAETLPTARLPPWREPEAPVPLCL